MRNPSLRITDSTGSRVVVIDKPILTIGRRSAADVHVHNLDVSKEHAEIVREGEIYMLRDRGSRYGTFVNGERVTEHTLLRGDLIRLSGPGGAELIFDSGAADSTLGLRTGTTDLQQMAAIMDGLRAIGSGRVLADVLTHVIDSALETTKAERGFILLANDAGELELSTGRRQGRQNIDGQADALSVKVPRAAFESGEVRIVDDVDLDSVDHHNTFAAGIRRVVCVPLRVTPVAATRPEAPTDRVIGVLYLDHHAAGRTDPRSIAGLEAFATQAAMAIESTRLYAEAAEKARIDRDLRIAADIQRLLQAQPTYAGPACELAAVSIPCRTVGGDFYDYLEIADGRFSFALGDVAGKGPPAALLATAVQSNFVAYASLGGSPAATTAHVNAALLRRPIEARFATMFHGLLSRDGWLSYCSAGHEPPCVIGAQGVRWLETGGPVLGLLDSIPYDCETVRLAEHDLVVVCSDGVTEAANLAGDFFGRARIVETVRQCGVRKPEVVLDHLIGAVRAFSRGTPQADDITAMVLRVGAAFA